MATGMTTYASNHKTSIERGSHPEGADHIVVGSPLLRNAAVPPGRGGSQLDRHHGDFRSCFGWLEERGITPQTLVFLTDLWGTFPGDVPPYPVLWASTGKREAPFGQVIPMEAA